MSANRNLLFSFARMDGMLEKHAVILSFRSGSAYWMMSFL